MHTKKKLEGVKHIIQVSSGKGGVGKSTVAANLARAFSKLGNKVGLMDGDIFGPSVPILFGIENERPEIMHVGEAEKILPVNQFGIDIVSIGNFVDPDKAIIWRGPLASNAVSQILSDVLWQDIDVLILDMPPGTSDIHLTIAQDFEIDGAVIVTTPQRIAGADALKSGKMFQNEAININILGIIENMAYFETEKLPGEKFFIFGNGGGDTLAKELGTEVLGQIPLVEEICTASDTGVRIQNSNVNKTYMQIAERITEKVFKK